MVLEQDFGNFQGRYRPLYLNMEVELDLRRKYPLSLLSDGRFLFRRSLCPGIYRLGFGLVGMIDRRDHRLLMNMMTVTNCGVEYPTLKPCRWIVSDETNVYYSHLDLQ